MKKAAWLFGLQFLSFFIIVANTRAYTQGLYFWTGVTDMAFGLLNFAIVKRVTAAETWTERIGYACGGTVGALVGIYVSKHLYGA